MLTGLGVEVPAHEVLLVLRGLAQQKLLLVVLLLLLLDPVATCGGVCGDGAHGCCVLASLMLLMLPGGAQG